MNLENRNRLTDFQNKLMVAGGRIWGRYGLGVWDRYVHTVIFKQITNKDLLYHTWNSAQCYVAAWMEAEFGEEWILVYVWMNTLVVHLKLSC